MQDDELSAIAPPIAILLDQGLVTRGQIQDAQKRSDLNAKDLCYNLVETGSLSEELLLDAWSRLYEIPKIRLSDIVPDPELVSLLPAWFCEINKIVPMQRVGSELQVAVSGPLDSLTLAEAARTTLLQIKPVLLGPVSMEQLLKKIREVRVTGGPISSSNDTVMGDIVEDQKSGVQESLGKKTGYTLMPVYFATNRAADLRGDPLKTYFTGERNENGRLAFGRCIVSVPADHRTGRVERPSWLRLEFYEDKKKHFVITDIVDYTGTKFYIELKAYCESISDRAALVFIHGFNVSFLEAVRRTAQIAYDLEFTGPAICFSWPSEATIRSYLTDENNSRWSVSHFEQFLVDLRGEAHVDTVQVIAHSMGSRILAEAFAKTGENFGAGHIIFAAPDIDADIFKELTGTFGGGVNRITLYASSNDEALKLSRKLHGGYTRAGETISDVLVVSGVDSVDASCVNTALLGHSYYGENRSIISDIYYLLRSNLPPSERFGMQQKQNKQGLVYWAFRP